MRPNGPPTGLFSVETMYLDDMSIKALVESNWAGIKETKRNSRSAFLTKKLIKKQIQKKID